MSKLIDAIEVVIDQYNTKKEPTYLSVTARFDAYDDNLSFDETTYTRYIAGVEISRSFYAAGDDMRDAILSDFKQELRMMMFSDALGYCYRLRQLIMQRDTDEALVELDKLIHEMRG